MSDSTRAPGEARAGALPHWERGFRCHGLWRDDGVRIGVVGLGPRRLSDGLYRWSAGENAAALLAEGAARSLRDGKRAVEAALGLPPCPATSRATGSPGAD